MMSSRGVGKIDASKMPSAKKKARRDDTDFTQYVEGGKVNAAGNYTKPSLRERIVSQVKAAATTKEKRAGKAAGKQFVAQPKRIAKKTAGFR